MNKTLRQFDDERAELNIIMDRMRNRAAARDYSTALLDIGDAQVILWNIEELLEEQEAQ